MNTGDLYGKSSMCCGCSMCSIQCPKQIIKMCPDNLGFYYPIIENESECINCKKCLMVCPLKSIVQPNNINEEKYYAGSMMDDDETISCSSGGLATAFAKSFVQQERVVYGAAYSNNWEEVHYIRAVDMHDIEKLKTSKYSQTVKHDCFSLLKEDLLNGQKCLFIGLPCDVAAVNKSFGKYDNLFTVELICHGPTSSLVQKEFCENIARKHKSPIVEFSTRYKQNGNWIPFYIYAKTKNGKVYKEQFHLSSYGAAFRYLKRPSCYNCPIKERALTGDIMVGDYHYIEKGMKGYNKHGVSSCIVRTNKGKKLMEMLDDSFSLFEIQAQGALANAAIHRPIQPPKGQEIYQKEFIDKGLIEANRLWIVKKSRLVRLVKAPVLKAGVKIKRIIIPSSRPV